MKGSGIAMGVLGTVAGLSLLHNNDEPQESASAPETGRERLSRLATRVQLEGGGLYQPLQGWPVSVEAVTSLGHDTNKLRLTGWHQGLDIRTPAGTQVLAPEDMTVIGVHNGVGSKDPHWAKAGLWVDARGAGGRILRFLHLAAGSARVRKGQIVKLGELIGEVANTGDSGVENSGPHLHFEVRRSDWVKGPDAKRVNPAMLLPIEGSPLVLRQLASLRQRHQSVA